MGGKSKAKALAALAIRPTRRRGSCALCGREVSDKLYCYGCASYVCDGCDATHIEGVPHAPADHQKAEGT